MYNRLCIGHTRLTYSYLMNTQIFQNVQTKQLFYVKHIVTECISYGQIQHQYYSVTHTSLVIHPGKSTKFYLKRQHMNMINYNF